MFDKLKQKWKVSGVQFWLIMTTFAVTGSTTAWITRKITDWVGAEKYSPGWWGLKLSILLVGYQLLILFFGGLFGQFRFFWSYEKKILQKLGFLPKKTKNPIFLAVFASGKGSNFEKIVRHFGSKPYIRVSLLVSNNPGAGALEIARQNNIPLLVISREDLKHTGTLARRLMESKIDFIVLAGFLWKLPQELIEAFRGKILNIHPALLPKFGGRGMYGSNVHEAVIAAGEKKSGISIHLVDEHYDNGDVIFRAECPVDENETAESLAEKIHLLEHAHFPEQIEKFIEKKNLR